MHDPMIIHPPEWVYRRRTGICLNMIVKNETPVIGRLLHSVKPYIDYFIIADTGSTDDTPLIVERLAKEMGLAGEIHFCDWVDFSHNRQLALDLAVSTRRGDWLLLIDADNELVTGDPQFFESLVPGVTYQLQMRYKSYSYYLKNLIDIRDTRWRWRAPVHEYLEQLDGPKNRCRCPGAWIVSHPGEGVRSRGVSQEEKALRDATILAAELQRNPDDTRSLFFLAHAYRNAGRLEEAFELYARRIEQGGWDEEIFISQYERAKIAIRLGHNHESIVNEHLKAYHFRPTRAEPLWHLARYYRQCKRYQQGYETALKGLGIPPPEDILLVQQDVYVWRMHEELAYCAFFLGRYQEAVSVVKLIFKDGECPNPNRAALQKILDLTELNPLVQ